MIARKRSTIKDVAKAAGVSTATVSQALRPRPDSNIKVAEDTVNKVKAAARKLNYRLHSGAQSIRSKAFKNLGFFTAKEGVETHSPDGYLAGVHDRAEEQGYKITHIRLPRAVADIQHSLPSIFNERNLDALIIGSYHSISAEIHEQLKGDNLPLVYLNDKHSTNSVYLDDVRGAEIMTRHLIRRGHTRIAFILRKQSEDLPLEAMHHSAKDRLAGYMKVMKEAGLEPTTRTVFAIHVVGKNHQFPSDWLDWVKDFDALFAYDDDLANQIGRHLYKNRLRVPDDIALAGYNGDYGSLSAWHDLTTMRIPSYEMGRGALDIALALVENGNTSPIPSLKFEPSLVAGETA